MLQIQQQACRGCGTLYNIRRVQVSMKTGGQLLCPKCGASLIEWVSVDHFYQFEGRPNSAVEMDIVRLPKTK